jgi:hypothetical protein
MKAAAKGRERANADTAGGLLLAGPRGRVVPRRARQVVLPSLPSRVVASTLVLRCGKALVHLPAFEQEMLLRWIQGWSQARLARAFKCAQPTVNYRLRRAIFRMLKLAEFPELTTQQILKVLAGYDPLSIEIVARFYLTSCQRAVALALGRSQGQVRHRLVQVQAQLAQGVSRCRCRKRLKLTEKLLAALTLSLRFPNILREVGSRRSMSSEPPTRRLRAAARAAARCLRCE